jgi:hypothetical protein
MIDQAIATKLNTLTQCFESQRNIQGNFCSYCVPTEKELNQLICAPPAMAFVLETGDLYFRHGPEFWFGRLGTQEKGWNDREVDRWIRAPYSGRRAIIQATHISKTSAAALGALIQMVSTGPNAFTANKYGASYWVAIEQAYLQYINTTFVELNTLTCDTEGSKLYDIEEGDIVIETGARFVQQRSKQLDTYPKRFNYPLELVGTKAMVEGTPGLHIFYPKTRENFMDIHPERMCYVILSKDHTKGTKTLEVDVYPASVSAPQYGSNPRQWQETRTIGKHTWQYEGWDPITWDVTNFDISAPTNATPGDWYINKFFFVNVPVANAPLKITNFAFDSAGAPYPDGLKCTITLEQGYPCPVLSALGGICFDPQPYWDAIAPVRPSLSFEPIGTYGSYIDSKTITGYLRPRSTKGKLGYAWPWVTAGQSIDLFDTVDEQWGGMKGHSPLRGLSIGDYIKMPEHDNLYKVTYASKNRLENPSSFTTNKNTHPLILPLTNVYGISIGGEIEWYPNIELNPAKKDYRGTVSLLPYCPWSPPAGDMMGIPIIIDSIRPKHVTLTAPLPCDLPKGTRLNIYASCDNDMVTYAYYDYYEFAYRLAKWNRVHWEMTQEAVLKDYYRMQDFYNYAYGCYDYAKTTAMYDWFIPPFFVWKPLRQFKWDDRFNEYGGTYPEVLTEIQRRMGEILAVAATQMPGILYTDYMSVLDYRSS